MEKGPVIQTEPLMKVSEGRLNAVVEVSSNNSPHDAFDGVAPSDVKAVKLELTPSLQRTLSFVPPWIR